MQNFTKVFLSDISAGFCGAPFENDGVLEHRILRSMTGFLTSKTCWVPMRFIFLRSLSLTHGYNTRIIQRSIPDLAQMRTFPQFVTIFTKKGSSRIRWCIQPCRSWFQTSGCLEKSGFPVQKTGSISVLTVIPTITTVCGMKAGKAIMTWLN